MKKITKTFEGLVTEEGDDCYCYGCHKCVGYDGKTFDKKVPSGDMVSHLDNQLQEGKRYKVQIIIESL